jgi:tRNA uridine 5-carboxymethylaminomethyl modification enzyme
MGYLGSTPGNPKEKLSHIKPDSLGRASRVEGITPAAVSAIMIALKALKRKNSGMKATA